MKINTLIALMVLSGFVLGIGATLIAQYINRHVDVEVTFTHEHPFHIKEHPYDKR